MSILKKLFFISLLFAGCLSHAGTWTAVQWLTPPRAACNVGFGGIPTNYLECTLQLSKALSAGDQVTISFVNNNDMPFLTGRQVSYGYACVSPGGANTDCNASNNTETIVLHHGGTGNNCAAVATATSGNTVSVDCATILLTAGGANYITIGRTDNGLAETMSFSVLEISTTSLTPSIDYVSSASINALTVAANITPVTVSGNDAIVQCISSNPTGINAPYSSNVFTQAHFGYSYALNIGSGAAPTWTVGPSPGKAAAGCAVAWTDGGSTAPNPVCTPGSGTYTTAQTVSCSDSAPVICTDPTLTPKTDGISGCAVGTKYTGSIFVPVTQNLNTIAGGSGFTDSSVVSYAYTIHAPYASVSPSSLTFSSQTVGSTSPLQSVVLSNIGFISSGLLIASISTTGDFAQTSTCPNPSTPLPSGGSCTVSVTFTPTTTGARTGVLTFTDNSTGTAGTTQTVLLTGTGASTPNPGITLNCSGSCSFKGLITLQSVPGAPPGAPLAYAARTDLAVFGTGAVGELLPASCSGVPACLSNAFNGGAATGHQGAALIYTGSPTQNPPPAGVTVSGTNINGLNSYLAGINSAAMPITDPDFGTKIYRVTDASLFSSVTCLGGGNFGSSFSIGAGGKQNWSVLDETGKYKFQVLNTGGSSILFGFNPSSGTISPSDICGGYMPGGASFSSTDPHTIYTVNNGNQENTVLISSTTGSFITPEIVTQTSTGAVATILAVNSTFVQLGPATGSPDGTHIWTGSLSGAKFTPNSSTPGNSTTSPFADTLYLGIICDGINAAEESVCVKNPVGGTCLTNDPNPECWYIFWTLVFNYNYVATMVGDPHFPTGPNTCLPAGFNSNYNGVFSPSADSTVFTVVFGDNGQNNHTGYNGGGNAGSGGDTNYSCPNSPGGVCQGPVYQASFKAGSGCRVFNTMTDTITGDWGPGSPGPTTVTDQQAFDIPGTLSTSPAPLPGDIWTQDTTGATTQLICSSAATTGTCPQLNGANAFIGVIYGGNAVSCTNSGADATHTWRDTNSGTLTPSGCPVNAPFIYPDVLHDGSQFPNSQLMSFSLVQQPFLRPSLVSYNATTHLTTVAYSGGTYSPGQQFIFFNLGGANDTYLNCSLTNANSCPVWTAVIVPNTGNTVCPGNGPYCPSGSGGTITISDTQGGPSNYSNSESQTGCGKLCPVMEPNPQDQNLGSGGFGGQNYWHTQSLTVAADLRATGHSATGDHTVFQGKFYTAINAFSPWTPATIADSGSPNTVCQSAGSPCGSTYPGSATPPPGSNSVSLLPASIVDDQHGCWGSYGTQDQTPPCFVTALVCGQATTGGVGSAACEGIFASVWDSEIVAIENAVNRSSPGNLVGADCNYGTGTVPCVYRLAHTFNTNSNWLFAAQNALANGGMSADGQWLFFPTDWNLTLGCMDRTTTNCWSSWQATAPNATGSGTAWSVDGSGNVSITMNNQFCSTGGTQYWYVAAPLPPAGNIQSINCGTRAGTVVISGFTLATWLNGTFTLGANTSNNWGCDSTTTNAGQCTTFIGTNSVSLAHAGTSGTETGGAQKASPTTCSNGTPCQRTDMFLAHITTAHQ